MYVFQIFEYYSCSGFVLLLVLCFEAITVGWLFGKNGDVHMFYYLSLTNIIANSTLRNICSTCQPRFKLNRKLRCLCNFNKKKKKKKKKKKNTLDTSIS